MTEEGVLLMDGDCGLCSHIANFLYPRLKDKGSLKFIANGSEEGSIMISKFIKRYQKMDTIYLLRNGRIYIRSGAGIRCLLYMKWHYKIWFPLLWLIPLPLRDISYIIIARYRHQFFTKPAYCIFPDLN